MDADNDKDAGAVPPAGNDDREGRNRSEGITRPPTVARIFRVAAGLSTWTREEKAYLKDHLGLIAYHDQLQATLQDVKGEFERESNFQARIDEAKNKSPENDDDRDKGPSRGGR